MTPTPETDQWETYCDECYYHMWRLRRKTERGWHDGFHIHTGDEAKGLCDLLNKLERERDEARGQLAGIEDKMRVELGGHPNSKLWGEAGLIAATMRCVDALGEVTDQRDRLLEEREQWRLSSVCRELIEQRDRLAEALKKVVTAWDFAEWLDENDIELFREAIQPLTTNEISNQ